MLANNVVRQIHVKAVEFLAILFWDLRFLGSLFVYRHRKPSTLRISVFIGSAVVLFPNMSMSMEVGKTIIVVCSFVCSFAYLRYLRRPRR